MKMKKITSKLSAVLCAAAFFTMPVGTAAFSDVDENAWYAPAVEYVSENGYFKGISETEFDPHGSMTRAMLAAVTARMADADISGYTSEFSDTDPSMWYSPYVGWASANGIALGFPDGSFHPDEPVTMEQAAVFIERYADKYDHKLTESNTADFADENDISDWAKAGVDRLRNAGVICVGPSNRFAPQRTATRADIAAALTNLFTSAGIARISAAQDILDGMTLEEKIYQMFIVRPESITGVGTVIQAGETTKAALSKYPVGGFIYSAKNLISRDQTAAMISNAQSFSDIGLFISVDEEGGNVARIAQKLGTTVFSPMYTYHDRGAGTAEFIYKTIAGDIKQFGFNLDFAPVADVWTNPENKVIGTRAFSDNANTAALMVGSAVKGLQDNGVCASVKHFPGHGNTAGDSHTGMVYSNKTLSELEGCELIPFRSGIDAGAEFVMIGHIIVPAVDTLPASLSRKWITDILRKDMGFDGIVITDGMEMGAIAANYTSGDAAIRAVEAGCDVILQPDTFTEAASALIDAVRTGRISEDRINESVLRILDCKERYGILQ